MGFADKRRKRNETTPGPSSHPANDDFDGPIAYTGLLSQFASRIFAKDALLEAAADGWGTTCRYTFLLLMKRVTAVGGIWIAAELAHGLRWF